MAFKPTRKVLTGFLAGVVVLAVQTFVPQFEAALGGEAGIQTAITLGIAYLTSYLTREKLPEGYVQADGTVK